jgi:hypothetical protein
MTVIRFSFGLLMGLSLATAASAAEARGRIIQINSDKNELRLDARGPRRGTVLDLTVGPKTRIFIGGRPGTLNDLTPGRRVRVVFEERDGKSVAREIRSPGLRAAATQSSPAAAPPKEGDGMTGTLQRVALTDREVVIVGPGAKGPRTETTITVPEKTPITRDGKAIAFDALKEGETVTVKTQSQKGQLTAVSIQVGQTAATASAQPPRRPLIPRLRQALKLADELLRQMEDRR